MANFAFSLCAAAASLVIAVASAVKGVWVVAAVFGMLTVGFLLRASERRG
jgi:FlaG/FlaF family flagellin (archaellin)